MINPRVLAEDPELVKTHLRRRHADESVISTVDEIVELQTTRKTHVLERDDLRATRNSSSKQIGALFKAGKGAEAGEMKAAVTAGNDRIKVLEAELDVIEARMHDLAMHLPNLLHDTVPAGKTEDDNPVERTWGDIPTFDFTPQAHVEVGAKLGILDLERSTKLTGARFAILRGMGARMERALINFFLDLHTGEHGHTEVMVPYMVHAHVAEGTGQLPKFADDMFKLAGKVNGEDAYLIPTAEIPVTNIHREEILDIDKLPIKFACFTPCFRSEAGSAGRDVRGIIRQHQFHKVEMVWLTTPERAEADHHQMVDHAETALKRLGIPYRVVRHCGGEVSFAAHKCFDLEAWLPSQDNYREISSVSWFTDFQSRRMKMRFRPAPVEGKKQKPRLVHTLNGSGLAVGRTMVAILENYQQADGSVIIPEALRPYMGGIERLVPPAE
ncbi:MAG: serine--tRNA ligase [Rhodobacterales bacterium]|nr:serine--tRNA ligase [Rhodobacterales bacterium]